MTHPQWPRQRRSDQQDGGGIGSERNRKQQTDAHDGQFSATDTFSGLGLKPSQDYPHEAAVGQQLCQGQDEQHQDDSSGDSGDPVLDEPGGAFSLCWNREDLAGLHESGDAYEGNPDVMGRKADQQRFVAEVRRQGTISARTLNAFK